MLLDHITSSLTLSNFVKVSDLWNQIIAYEKFAEFISEVEKINRLPDNCTEWFITLENTPFTWVEADVADKNAYTLKFHSISGDFEHYCGSWKIINDSSHRAQLILEFDYHFGIPVLENMTNNILREKMQKFAESLLNAHAEKVTLASRDVRVSKRFKVGKSKDVAINNKTHDVHIVNISDGGLMLTMNKDLHLITDDTELKIKIESLTINGKLIFEPFTKCYRILFSEKLAKDSLQSILTSWNDQTGEELIKVFEVLTSDSYSTTEKIPAK